MAKKAAPKPKALEELSDEELNAEYARATAPKPLEEMSDEELNAAYLAATAKPPEGPGAMDKVETTLRSGFEGATAGISEPVISGINAALDAATDYVPGVYDATGGKGFIERAKDRYSADVARRKGLKEALPGYDIAGQVGGTILPSPINVGARIFKGASALAKSLPGIRSGLALTEKLAPVVGPAAKATLLQKAGMGATKVAVGAGEGAIGGVGFEGVRQVAEGATGFDDTVGPDTVLDAGKTGGIIGAAVPIVGKIARSVPGLGKKALSSLGGVKVSDIDEYLLDPTKLDNVKSPDEIYTLIEQATGKLRQGVDDAVLTREQAERAFERLERQTADAAKRNRFDLGESVRDAKASLDKALADKVDEVKRVRPPSDLADDINAATEEVKQKLIAESNKATELLSLPENASKSIPKKGLLDQIDNAIDGLKVEGEAGAKVAISETAELAISRLEKVKERFAQLKADIPLSQAKEITKQIDKDITFLENAGAFHDDPSNAAMVGLRKFLREEVGKQVPAYDQAMKEIVAPLGELRAEASRRWGKRDAALSKLTRIDSDALQVDREILDQVAAQTGRDFKTPLAAYREAQAKLTGSGKAAMEAALPEAAVLREAEALKASAGQPGAEAWEVANRTAMSNEAKVLQAARAQEAKAKEIFDEVQMLTTGNVETRVNAMMRGNNRKVRTAFESLSKLSDQDFVGMLDKMRLNKSFSGEFRIGSRNVNLWAIMSVASSVLSGGLSLPALAAAGSAGAMFGGLVDRFGPAMTRKILGFVSGVQGMPSVQKIMRSSLPKQIKDELIRDLTIFTIMGDRDPTQPIMVPAEQRRQMRYDIRNAPNYDSVQKAKMIDRLNRTGELLDSDGLILGGVPRDVSEPVQPKPRDPAPGERLRSVSDFVRNKKPETY